MKLIIPDIEIQEDMGFDTSIDIFKRNDFGERLANLIENTDDNPVFALDAEWGEGKSTFIKMWRGYLEHKRESPIKTVYFDAFENDYQKDPFLTLASEIYSLLEDEDEKKRKEFIEKATNAAKSLMRGAIKIGVKVATAGIVDGTAIATAEKEISNLISGKVDEIIADRFKNVVTDKLALQNFKIYLEKFAADISKDKPMVFIIDELDRCRPDFALELLEQIKHLFSVQGITFLLVTNRTQLEQSIRTRYGIDIDPTNYLHKFINLWITLPRKCDKYHDSGTEFLNYAISEMKAKDEKIQNDLCIEVFNDIVKHYKISYREIERMLSYFAIIHNMAGDDKYYSNYQYMISFVCFIKATNPNLLKTIVNNDCDKFIKESGLFEIKEQDRSHTLYRIKNLVTYCFHDDKGKKTMIQEKIIHSDNFGQMPPNFLLTISLWLSEINNR